LIEGADLCLDVTCHIYRGYGGITEAAKRPLCAR
jgi:hypothetical protein